ncbi:MAG: exodeoxyribonuclease VII small subunit, partial [Oceanospirillaceae bacterium]|nr:exodeoxyribonuclease VII small subunit [Oceanospirillaceae bacterium]
MPDKKPSADFETSLKRLETLVTQMEQGDMPIEDALKAFEEGIGLTRECQTILDQAEQKV